MVGLLVHGSRAHWLRVVLRLNRVPMCARSLQRLAASSRGVRLLQLAW